jgi:hypothetical protein
MSTPNNIKNALIKEKIDIRAVIHLLILALKKKLQILLSTILAAL